MANITRYRTAKGENRYRVRYRKPDGTQTDKRGFRRKIDAETWAAEHVTIAKATGSYIDPEGGKQRIGTLHDQWIAEKKPFWKATSGSNMDSAWKCHCEAKWAERQIGSITHAEVQAWVGSIIDKSGAPSVSRPYQIMQGICSMAVRDKLISVFCQVGVGRFGVSFSPCERRVSGRFGVGRSCWLLVIALVIA